MAFAATVAWEVQTGGNDANGGGFDAVSGTPGTDYSQQTAAQVAFTDLVIDGTTNTDCTSAGNPFTSAHVGNIVNITGGTGFTVQRVQIMSVTAGVARMDKSLGTLGSTGGTGNLGGCLLTWGAANSLAIAGNTIWIKSGTYTLTSTVQLANAGTNAKPVRWIGYQTTRGDDTGTRPVLTSATNSVALITVGVDWHVFRNIKFTHTATTRGYGFHSSVASRNYAVFNCEFDGCLSANKSDNLGAEYSSYCIIISDCWIHDCTGYGLRLAGCVVTNCVVEGNAGGGILIGTFINSLSSILDCLIVGNTGDGIDILFTNTQHVYIKNCVIAGNSSDGMADAGGYGITFGMLLNNIFFGNGGYGLNFPAGAGSALLMINNAFKDNTSGQRSSTVPAGENDITLTANPFTDSASGDYSLNNTAGGGALLRALSYPTAFPDGLTDDYRDIGAAQHADPVGGSGGGGGGPIMGGMVVR